MKVKRFQNRGEKRVLLRLGANSMRLIALSLYLSSGAVSAVCVDSIVEYSNSVNEKRAKLIDACATADRVFSDVYRKYRLNGKKRSELSATEQSQAQAYFTSCFHSIDELGSEKSGVFKKLKSSFERYLYILVAKDEESSVAFCSSVALGAGFAAPAHCFENSVHRKGLGTPLELQFWSPQFLEDGRVEFASKSFNKWEVYSLQGLKYKALKSSDFYYFLPPSTDSVARMLQDTEPYRCGQTSFIGGLSTLYLNTLRYHGKKASLNNASLIGGYRSWCLGMEKEGKDVVKHLCSSTGGQSGAPILVDNGQGFRPVGMHLGGEMVQFDPENESASNYMFIFRSLKDKSLRYNGTAESL